MWCVLSFLLFESILHFFFWLCCKEKLCGGIIHCSLVGYYHLVVLIWGKSKVRKKEGWWGREKEMVKEKGMEKKKGLISE